MLTTVQSEIVSPNILDSHASPEFKNKKLNGKDSTETGAINSPF